MKSIAYLLFAAVMLAVAPAQAGWWDDASDEARDKAEQAKEAVVDKSKELAEQSKDKAADWADSASEAAKSWWQKVAD